MTRTERLERLRKILLFRRDELMNRAGKSFDSNDSGIQNGPGDFADMAHYNETSDLQTQLESLETDELTEINVALKKFSEGKYGLCEVSGQPIPITRLEALPYTRLSVEQQRILEEANL